MPNYEYKCEGCDDEFTEIRTFENYNKPKQCIKCGAATRKLISSGISLSSACVPTRDMSSVKESVGERVQNKELWGDDVTRTINENVGRIKAAKKSGGVAKLEKLPNPKAEAKEAALRGYVKHGAQKALRQVAEQRTATSNIY